MTGSLSSGKTTVCQFLRELGAYVVSADEVVHHLLASDTGIKEKIALTLGEDVLVHNQLDRERIAKKVFSDPAKLQFLETLLHPLVQNELCDRYEAVKNDPRYTFFVAEIPLLYETHMESLFDWVVVVTAKETTRKNRFHKRNKQETSLFAERMIRQWSCEEKAKRADFVITNNTDLANLKNEVAKIVPQFYPTRR